MPWFGRQHAGDTHLSLASGARPEVESRWKSVAFWVQGAEADGGVGLVYKGVHVAVERESVL